MNRKVVRALCCAFLASACAFNAAAHIVIDAAHGGKDFGASGTYMQDGRKITLLEKDIVLTVAQKIRKILAERNAADAVGFIRMSDDFLSFEQRAKRAAENKTAHPLVVSLHVNASLSPSLSGFEVWAVSADKSNSEAAASLSSALEKAIGGKLPNRGIKTWDSESNNADILVEFGFLSTAHDAKLLADDEFLELCARSIADWVVASGK